MTSEVLHTYEFHEACLMLPAMAADEYQALRASIRDGFDATKPIELFDGKILDGRHRYQACQDEGVTPKFISLIGINPYEHVRKVHEGRRSWMNQVQKALVVGELIEKSQAFQDAQQRIREEANRKRAAAAAAQIAEQPRDESGKVASRVVPQIMARPGKDKPETTQPIAPIAAPIQSPAPAPSDKSGKEPCLVAPQVMAQPNESPKPIAESPKPKPPERTTTAKAALIGVNRGAVEQAQSIKKASPKLADKVAKGEITPAAAIREIKKAEVHERLSIVAAKESEAPTGLYDVIVIDPPWPMQKIERDERPNQVAFDYPVMSEEALAKLPIPADTNCHVWLWTTHKFMPMALRLLDAWSLKYVCTFVWHKPGGFQPIGLPQFNCEFALYARRGAPVFLETTALPVCFQAPRGGHSEKPEAFYDVVRRVTGGRRLDMFNRRKIDGFTGWGKEAAA